MPAFNTSYLSDAVSLTAGQKMRLAFRSSIDPVTFAVSFVVAGYHEGMHDDVGFPWGIKGYGERSGAAYLDAFNGGMIGNGILPAILHQDPATSLSEAFQPAAKSPFNSKTAASAVAASASLGSRAFARR